jgi:putative spermidine/putrescine transport system ATP-binding protein
MVRLDGLGDRRPAQLSGGQQQRVALARALVFEPPVVLLDEPLGALDKSLREEMQLELRALHRRLGVTMLHVTHDQAEALTLADRIAVFAGGALRQLATPRALYDEPADAFVAGFVGENNRLPGTLLRVQDGEAEVKLNCGPHVWARLPTPAPVGARCVVTVRPERVAVSAVAAAELGEGALPARLEEAIFQGDHVRVRLSLGTDGVVIARRPPSLPLPAPGEAASVAWEDGHALAFAEPTT